MPDRLVCDQCRRDFERPGVRGPVPKFCSGACRQAAFRDRHRKTVTGGWAYMQHGTISVRSHSHYWRDGFTVSLCGQATEPRTTLQARRRGQRVPDDCHQCHVHLDKLTR